jgi:hypothetical protein
MPVMTSPPECVATCCRRLALLVGNFANSTLDWRTNQATFGGGAACDSYFGAAMVLIRINN